MTNVIELASTTSDPVDKAVLHRMALAMVAAPLSVEAAQEFLDLAFRRGLITGKRDAYRAANKMIIGQAGE